MQTNAVPSLLLLVSPSLPPLAGMQERGLPRQDRPRLSVRPGGWFWSEPGGGTGLGLSPWNRTRSWGSVLRSNTFGLEEAEQPVRDRRWGCVALKGFVL